MYVLVIREGLFKPSYRHILKSGELETITQKYEEMLRCGVVENDLHIFKEVKTTVNMKVEVTEE